jgi:Holliday junction resolvase
MNFDDLDDAYHVEKFKNKKKGVNGNRKGKRVERELVAVLNDRFKGYTESFSRSVGSGNRWGQVKNLPTHAKETFSGDICCPKGFKFVLESKGGYNKIDLNSVFEDGISDLDSFLEQVQDESKRTGKMPMLLWKKDRKPWIAFVKTNNIQGEYNYKIIYREWTAIKLAELLKLEDNYFFENP